MSRIGDFERKEQTWGREQPKSKWKNRENLFSGPALLLSLPWAAQGPSPAWVPIL